MTILLIEDDAVLSDGLFHTLRQSGYEVVAVATAAEAKARLHTEKFSLIILDLGLPDMDGLTLLQQLRQQAILLPILILTARDKVRDRVEGIKQGADDYLAKPFELRELEARINALLRRCYRNFDNQIESAHLRIDLQHRQIFANAEPIPLSKREYVILEPLLLQAGKVISKEQIAQRLANEGAAQTDNAIDICIHRLRKRIEGYGFTIRTIRGLGYLLEQGHDEENTES